MMYRYLYICAMPGSKRYSISGARDHLPGIVKDAEAGFEIELTRRGKPVAVIISLQEYERLHTDRPRFKDTYRAFLEQHPLTEEGLEADDFTSLRDRTPGREVSL
jgi:prevent-host-death family protein